MRKISFFKRIKLFREYLKIVKSNRGELDNSLGSRVDWVGRIYTVVNVPVEAFGDNFNLRKADIDKISENYIDEYRTLLSRYLNSVGLIELYKPYYVEKVGKYSYKVVYGYSLFRSDKLTWNIIKIGIPLLALLFFIIFFVIF